MKFVYGALLLIASITPTTFIGLKLYKYAPNKYIAAFSTTDGIKIHILLIIPLRLSAICRRAHFVFYQKTFSKNF